MSYTGSQSQAGKGSVLSIGTSPVAIGEVKNAPMNRGKWKFVDVTNFESGADSETLPVIRDNGTISLEGNRVSSDAGQVAVEAAYQNGTLATYTLQLPVNTAAGQTTTGDKYVFKAYVESSDFTVDVQKEIDFKVSLRISGATTLTAGS